MNFEVMLVFTIMGLVLFACGIAKSIKNNKKDKKDKRDDISSLLFYFGALANVSQAVFVESSSIFVRQFVYCIYAISILWIVYYSSIFMQKFTALYKFKTGVKHVGAVISLMDTAMLTINAFIPFAFSLIELSTPIGTFYVVNNRTLFYYLHVLVCIIVLITPYGALAYKTFTSISSFYRRKYLYVFIPATIATAASIIFVAIRMPINITALIFGVTVLLADYFYNIRIPKMLRNQTMFISIQQMEDIVCILDIDNKLVFVNESGEKRLDREQLMTVIEDAEVMSGLEVKKDRDSFVWRDKVLAKSRDMTETREYPFEIHYNKLFYKNEVIGYYLLLHDKTEELNQFKEEHYRLTHDELTGLYNRTYFFERAHARLMSNCDSTYYLVISDIDNFKLFNELYGTEKGDAVLLLEADLLRRLTSNLSIYGRIGGDKFAVLLPEKAFDEKMFKSCIAKMREEFSDNQIKIVVRAGVYKITDHSEPLMSMFNKAQLAIASIDKKYSTLLTYYTNEMFENTLYQRWLIDELPGALERDEFLMYIQPQVDAESGNWRGGEALVRWKNQEKGMISPGEFVPLFEQMGVMWQVDEVIWEKAAAKLHEWNELGREDLYISVNVSCSDLFYIDIYERFVKLVEKYRIAPAQLRIEITESFMVSDGERRRKTLAALREYGFVVEIDDFGSGYSALNSLKDIPCDVIKIDMGFLRETDNIAQSNVILEMVIKLIKRLQKEIIVEGVETEEQVGMLSALGCELFQGYFYSKPIYVEEFEKKVLGEN